jgi:hypothetical protein
MHKIFKLTFSLRSTLVDGFDEEKIYNTTRLVKYFIIHGSFGTKLIESERESNLFKIKTNNFTHEFFFVLCCFIVIDRTFEMLKF